MLSICRSAIISLIAFPLLGTCAFAQETRPSGRIMPHESTPLVHQIAQENRPDLRYRAAEIQLAVGGYDPAVEPLLRAFERFTKVIFQLQRLEFQRAVTLKDQRGDSFTATWNVDEPFGKGSVILEDFPNWSWYYFRLTGCRLATREDVTRLVSALVVMEKPPVNVSPSRTKLDVFATDGSLTSFSWAFDPAIPSQFPRLREFYLMGVKDREDWFLTVGAGKVLSANYYPIKPFVPERFPTLAELVKTWSRTQIQAELTKRRPDLIHQANREEILLTELAGRGLSTDEIVELLREVAPGEEYYRLTHVRSVLKRAGTEVPAYFLPALHMYEQYSPKANDAVELLFVAVRKNCSPLFEQEALRVLKQGTFVGAPLTYLSDCASSTEALAAIEGVKVAPYWEQDKNLTIEQIRRRLGASKPAVR